MDKDIERELVKHEFGLNDIELKEESADAVEEINTEEMEEKAKDESSKLDLYDIAQCVISAFVVGILIFIFVFRVIGVKGDSMFPTLHNGDRIVASGILYDPQAGDVVILKSDYYSQPLVKRIIAVENQTVDIDFKSGIVYVDGIALNEPYIYESTHVDEGFVGPVTVPEGCLFVMGDNRNESNDSRSPDIGFIDEREIFGEVLWNLFPTDGHGGYDWSRFGAVR